MATPGPAARRGRGRGAGSMAMAARMRDGANVSAKAAARFKVARLAKLNLELVAALPEEGAHNVDCAIKVLQELRHMKPVPTAFQLCQSFQLLNTMKRVRNYEANQTVKDLAMYLWNMYKHICINTGTEEEFLSAQKARPPRPPRTPSKKAKPAANESTNQEQKQPVEASGETLTATELTSTEQPNGTTETTKESDEKDKESNEPLETANVPTTESAPANPPETAPSADEAAAPAAPPKA